MIDTYFPECSIYTGCINQGVIVNWEEKGKDEVCLRGRKFSEEKA